MYVMQRRKEKVWYRQMNFGGVEFQLVSRNPDGTHKLAVRSTADNKMVEHFDLEDPNGDKTPYLRAAETKFITEISERARRLRDARRKQHVADLRPELGDQVQKGPVGEQQGAPEGGSVQNDEAAQPVDAKHAGGRGRRSKASNQES